MFDFYLTKYKKLIILWKDEETLKNPLQTLNGIGKMRKRVIQSIARKQETDYIEFFSSDFEDQSALKYFFKNHEFSKSSTSKESQSGSVFLNIETCLERDTNDQDQEDTSNEFYDSPSEEKDEFEDELVEDGEDYMEKYEEIMRSQIFDDYFYEEKK